MTKLRVELLDLLFNTSGKFAKQNKKRTFTYELLNHKYKSCM